LLPFEQLLMLLDISSEELAHRLREDDFLWIKLGRLKPACAKVVYSLPSPEAQRRAAEIKQIVQPILAERLPREPLFHFIGELSQVEPVAASAGGAALAPAAGDPQSEHPRIVYSYFAMFGDPLSDPKLDPFPEGLLARLRDRGVNGIWLHVVLRELAPPSKTFPEFGAGHEARLKNLARLVEKAGRYGIRLYLYINEPRAMPEAFFQNRPEMRGVREGQYYAMCTSHPEVRKWVGDSLAYVFATVPGLGGVFTITASENLTNCASHFGWRNCPHCKDRTDSEILVEINSVIEEGVHRSAPKAKVIVWDWGWAGHGDASKTIAKLPASVWLMSVSEWKVPVERGGVKTEVGEYSISAVGPGPRATRHWQVAQQHGLKTLAKVQFNVTWELGSVPYLPVMDLIARHGANLAKLHLDGQMLSWTLGGYPSPNLELARLFADQPDISPDQALDQLAAKTYGKQAAPHVRRAWTAFSRAFSEYPYGSSGMYSGPQHLGPANLLYAKPTGYRAGMVCFPYDDLTAWSQPYSPEVYAAQFEKVATGWADGLKHLEAAGRLVPPDKRAFAADDLSNAKAAQLHFASAANQARYIAARNELAITTDRDRRSQLQQTVQTLLDQEIQAAGQLYRIASTDSRIGYEASNQYFYVPQDLIEKILNCHQLKAAYAK
jgi:hypothetical protein